MKTKQLGDSALHVSEICLGAMTFGQQNGGAEGYTQFDPFSLPMKTLDDARIVVRKIEALLGERKRTLRPPPPVPDTCCGRGCNGCVWQGYYEALAYWREQARALLR